VCLVHLALMVPQGLKVLQGQPELLVQPGVRGLRVVRVRSEPRGLLVLLVPRGLQEPLEQRDRPVNQDQVALRVVLALKDLRAPQEGLVQPGTQALRVS